MIPIICLIYFHGIGLAQDVGKETSDNQSYRFRHFNYSVYGQLGQGFMVYRASENLGFVTGNLEAGVIVRYYIARRDTVLNANVPADISLFLRAGWGPLMVVPNVVPNYWVANPGFTVSQFRTNVSYGLVAALNSSIQGADLLYGWSASLDQLPVPFFVSMLWGAADLRYIILAGIRVPIGRFVPLDKRR